MMLNRFGRLLIPIFLVVLSTCSEDSDMLLTPEAGEVEPAAEDTSDPNGHVIDPGMWLDGNRSGGPLLEISPFDGRVVSAGGEPFTVTRTTASTNVLIHFEGIPNRNSLNEIASAKFFGWLSTISDLAPISGEKTGKIMNLPTPWTGAFWANDAAFSTSQRDIAFLHPVSSVTLQYTSQVPVTLQALAANGTVLAQVIGLPNYNVPPAGMSCLSGYYCGFTPRTVSTGANTIHSIRLKGSLNRTGMDNLEFTRLNSPPVANAGGPYTAVEGGTLTLNGSATDPDIAYDTLSYAWNFGDSTTGTGATPGHAYEDNGSYTATLSVTDLNLASDVEQAGVTISNATPVATLGLPAGPAVTGSAITLPASFTDAGAKDHPWEWTIDWGNGTDTGTVGSGASKSLSLSHSYSSPGPKSVTFSVEDKDGAVGSATVQFTVNNLPPTAVISAPATVAQGTAVTLSASGSHTNPSGGTLTYAWNIDGQTTTSATPSVTYFVPGTHNFSVTVTDPAGGGSTTATGSIVVTNVLPAVTAGAVPQIAVNTAATVPITFADPGNQDGPWAYSVNWGNGQTSTGTFSAPGSGLSVSNTYATAGSFTVTVTVTDSRGGSGSAQTGVTVIGPPAVSLTGPTSGAQGSPLTFGATVTGAGGADSYAWTSGAGQTSTSDAPSFTYATPGTYTVSLQVTSVLFGLTSSATREVTISNVAPTVNGGTNRETGIGVPVTISPSFTDPGSDDGPWSYSVAWGDGQTSTGTTATIGSFPLTHTYTTAGTKTATVTVTDKHGGSSTGTVTVVVSGPPVVAIIGPATGNQGTALEFSANVSNGGRPVSYLWTVAGGHTSTSPNPSFIYLNPGTHTVTLEVTDTGYGLKTTETHQVVVSNVAPSVSAGTDKQTAVGVPVTVSASFADPGTNDAPWSYSIAWGDGQTTSGTASAPGVLTASHSYAAAGSFEAVVTVTDRHGGSDSDGVTVSVQGPPQVTINGPTAGVQGASVQFTANVSNGGRPFSYLWTVGSGQTSTAPNPSFTYPTPGTYVVTLKVTDSDYGLETTATHTIVIANEAPALSPGSPREVALGVPLTLSPTFTDAGTSDGPWSYSVAWGDGQTSSGAVPTQGSPFPISHLYTSPGAFTVTVTVTDKYGLGDSEQWAVTVVGPPVATITGPTAGAQGSAVQLGATVTNSGRPVTYLWTVGGQSSTVPNPSFIFMNPGEHIVTLVTTDTGNGLTGTDTHVVTVSNIAPTVAGGPDLQGLAGTAVALGATFSDPGASDGPWSYSIAWGDGQTSTGSVASQGAPLSIGHSYALGGSYTAVVTVTDAHGASGSDAVGISIVGAPGVSINGPANGTQGESLSFSANVTNGGRPVSYLWTVGTGQTSTLPNPSFIYLNPGSQVVTLKVTDTGSGLFTTAAHVVSVSNAAPVVNGGADREVALGSSMSLSPTFSDAGTNDGAWQYTIAWGDGQTSTGTRSSQGSFPINHVYATAGSYTATVAVTDKHGLGGSDQVGVTVIGAPAFTIAGPGTADQGSTVQLTANLTNGGRPVTYLWTVGTQTSTAPNPNFIFMVPGTYVVTASVTDTGTGLVTTRTHSISVVSVAPAVDAGPDKTGDAHSAISFSVNFEDPGTSDGPWTYSVAWGDGSISTGSASSQAAALTLSHTYTQAGSYNAVFTVADKYGMAGSDNVSVTVEPKYSFQFVRLRITPETINLRGNGNGTITAHFDRGTNPGVDLSKVNLGKTYILDAADVLRFGGVGVPMVLANPGQQKLKSDRGTISFNRLQMIAAGVLDANTRALIVVGELPDGRYILGSDWVRIND